MPAVGAFIAGGLGLTAPAIGSAAFGAYMAGVSVAGFLTTTVVGKLLTSVALSALARALTPRPREPGIRTTSTQTGGTTPESFILGRYATEGQLVCPPMSHGSSGKTPNAYLTYVIELGGVPGQQLVGVQIDGEAVTLGATAHPDYGFPVEGRFTGAAWVKYYDGTQVAADPMLLAKYGSAPERPWQSDMVGEGVCYAICTFRYARDVFTGWPKVRFVLDGIPMYDPRKDSTVGGSGAHRWADRATWEHSVNPFVMIYNLKRGIAVQGQTYGGGFDAADLPLAAWFAAMNACDASVAIDGEGGVEPAYRAGYEVYTSEEPAAVIEELLKTCAGAVSEVGGVWNCRAGAPGLPVFSFTDDDLIVDDSEELDPHPTVGEIANAVAASYPDPALLWEPRDAPLITDPALVTLDGGRQLIADLQFTAAPYPKQVQRLMAQYLRDNRRFRRHVLTLPAEAAALEPLDVVSWTSARHGYVARQFEVGQITDPLVVGRPRLTLREVDPDDWDTDPADLIPVENPDTTPVTPGALAVGGWTVTAQELSPGRVGILIEWDGEDLDGVTALAWDVRTHPAEAFVSRGQIVDVASGQALITEGILPNTAYQVRGVFVAGFPVTPTAWTNVTTPVSLFTAADLADVPALTIRGRKETTSGPEQSLTPAEARTVLELRGLGGVAPYLADAGVTDNSIIPGVYLYDTALGSVGGPANVTRASLWHARLAPGGLETQVLIVQAATAPLVPGLMFTRSRAAGAWEAWRFPGIVESGSSATGRWVRWQDGTQQTWQNVTASSAGEVAVTFPAAFSTAADLRPQLTPNSAGNVSLAARFTGLTATGMNVSVFSAANARVATAVSCTAIGRWY